MSRVDALAKCEQFDGFSVEYKLARDGRHCVAILWSGWKRVGPDPASPRRHRSTASQHASGPPSVWQWIGHASQIAHTIGEAHAWQVSTRFF